ncbi:MAG TPA: fibronectin type III domain-containing protein [Candidatus Limnocylindrales bacterium]|nr:fibronectin type III domain-containing protein [Candidatus Limnocylindrales bacterium]
MLYGSRISPITGQPVRHLWIGDTNFGLCRIDPDIDQGLATMAANPMLPSPFQVTITTCPFKLNGLSVTGGPMAYDPTTNNLYLVDEQTNSEGIFRLGFLTAGDGGEGAIDFNNIFAMAGAITGSRFTGGTTGCPFPNDTVEGNPAPTVGKPNGAALSPDGNLWVSFKKTGAILRINNPATATSTGFGTCNDFVQLVAETPAKGGGNGIAFIGPDLWGADAGGPFVIRNATRACQALTQSAPTTPTCGTSRPAGAFGALAPTTTFGDQTYPYQNGNNLYFGNATDDLWVGNISGGGTIVVNPFEPAGTFVLNANPVVNVNAITADVTDPANNSVLSGDDPSGNATLGAGRWWRVFQNAPAKADKPPQVTVTRATANVNDVTVAWSPAQSGQLVTSYTVHASTVPAGVTVPDVTVVPPAGGSFPPNYVTIPSLPSGTYAFRVTANNAQGNNGPANASNTVTLPYTPPPSIPTSVTATAGDTVAFVNFAAPPNAASQGITSYTITSLPGLFTTTVGPTATSGTVTGLTDGTTYTFTVHANNAGGAGMESTPSNPVTPQAQPTVTIKLTGPLSVTSVPIQSTYTATLTNNTATDVTATSFTYVLSQASPDGAFIVAATTGQGICTSGGFGVVTLNCNIGTLAAGATVNVGIVVQIQTNAITGTASFSGTDVALNTVSGSSTLNTATPGAPPTGNPGPTVTVAVSASSAKPSMNRATSTTHTFVATNTSSTLANNLSFTISEPSQLTITGFTGVSSAPATDPISCSPPAPGVLNNQTVNNIVCTIASLGGNLKNGVKPNTAQTITLTVNITAPNNGPLNLPVQAQVVFDGIDAVSPTASFTQQVK